MSISLLPRFRKLVASSGSVPQVASSPDSELVRQAKLVAHVLRQASRVLEPSERGNSNAWEDAAADVEELKQVEDALDGAGATLKSMRELLPRISYVSRHQADHYEGIVQLLERKRGSVGALVRQQKTNRLAMLASQTRVRRAIDAEQLVLESKDVALYKEEELQPPKFDDMTEEERQLLEQENQELQIGMMDQTVDMAKSILKQLSELSAINSQFALEISVQHEVF